MLSSVLSIEMALYCLEIIEFDYAATYLQVPEECNS